MSISENYPNLSKYRSEQEIIELLKQPQGEVKAKMFDEVTQRCEPMFNSPEYQEKLTWKYGGAYFDSFMSTVKDKSAIEQLKFIDLEVRRNNEKLKQCHKKGEEYVERASYYKLLMLKYDELSILAEEEIMKEDSIREHTIALKANTQELRRSRIHTKNRTVVDAYHANLDENETKSVQTNLNDAERFLKLYGKHIFSSLDALYEKNYIEKSGIKIKWNLSQNSLLQALSIDGFDRYEELAKLILQKTGKEINGNSAKNAYQKMKNVPQDYYLIKDIIEN